MAHVTHWHPMKANGAIGARRLVEPINADGEARQAAAAAAKVIGVSGSRAVAAGETVEAAITGIAEVEYGGNVTRGDLLTAAADGTAIATSTAGNRVVGVAMQSGVDGDIGEVLLSPGSV